MTPSMDLSGVSASLSSMDSDKIAGYLLAALSLIAIAATVAVAAFTSHGTHEALPILTLPFSVTGFLSYLYRRQWLLFVFSLAVCAVLYVLYPAAGIVAVFLLACTRGIALVASILQKRLFVPVMGSIERSGIGSGRMFSNRLAQSFFGIPPNVDTRVLRVERTVRRKGMPWPEIVDTMVMALAPSLLVWTALFAIWSFHITVVDAYTAVLTLSVLITMLVMPWLVLRSLNVRVGTEGGGMSVYKGLLGTSAHAAAALALLCVVVAFYLYTGVDTLGYILASAAMTAAVVTLSSWFYFLEYECGVVEFLTTDGSASIYMEGGQAASRNRLDDGIPGTPGRDGSSASSDQKY